MENIEINQKDIFGENEVNSFVIRSIGFYPFAISEHYETEAGKKISNELNEKSSRLKDNEFSYRVINHWEKVGLLNTERDSEKGWRKYSIIDLVWIQIIASLRSFGYPLEKILNVKKYLEMREWKHKSTPFPLFEMYIAMALYRRIAVYLLVFPNGEAEPLLLGELLASLKYLQLGDHIKISINDLLQKLYPNKELSVISNTPVELSDEEMDLIFMIRMQDFESIKIKTNDGKIEHVEVTEILKNDKRIIDILKESAYQNIEIKQAEGKIVTMKRTRKEKYDKKK